MDVKAFPRITFTAPGGMNGLGTQARSNAFSSDSSSAGIWRSVMRSSTPAARTFSRAILMEGPQGSTPTTRTLGHLRATAIESAAIPQPMSRKSPPCCNRSSSPASFGTIC